MPDFLSSLFQALPNILGSNQPQPPPAQQGQPQAMSAPQTPASQSPSGIGGFLSNPLVQGALASYFGAISSPRQMGWGGAIGRGGLAGLGAYGSAAAQQAELPYRQAMTQKTMAEAQAEQQKAQALGSLSGPAALAAYAPDASKYMATQTTNTEVAKQVLASHPNEPFAANVAQSIAQDNSKPYTLADAEAMIKSHAMEPLDIQGKTAEVEKTKAGTKQSEAAAAKDTAEAGLIPSRKEALGASAEASRARAKYLGASKPMTEAQIETAANQEGRAAQAAVKQGTFESKDAFQTRSSKAFKDAHDAAVDRLKNQGAAAKIAAASAPELPDGWTAGGTDSEGRPTAIDPSGVPHTFVGD